MSILKKETVSILAIVDVIGVLANESTAGNIYLIDNKEGSTGKGTGHLKTRLDFRKGNEIILVWNAVPIEPEAFITISQIEADKEYIELKKCTYEDSDLIFWQGVIKKPFETLRYKLSLQAGFSETEFICYSELLGILS